MGGHVQAIVRYWEEDMKPVSIPIMFAAAAVLMALGVAVRWVGR